MQRGIDFFVLNILMTNAKSDVSVILPHYGWNSATSRGCGILHNEHRLLNLTS